MILFFSSLLFLLAKEPQASIAPIFSRDSSRLTLVWNSRSTNDDAFRFFDWLKAPESAVDNRRVKQFRILGTNNRPGLELTCAFSKLVPGTGSCTIVLRAEGGALLDPSRGLGEWEAKTTEERTSFEQNFSSGMPSSIWFTDSSEKLKIGSSAIDGEDRPFLRFGN